MADKDPKKFPEIYHRISKAVIARKHHGLGEPRSVRGLQRILGVEYGTFRSRITNLNTAPPPREEQEIFTALGFSDFDEWRVGPTDAWIERKKLEIRQRGVELTPAALSHPPPAPPPASPRLALIPGRTRPRDYTFAIFQVECFFGEQSVVNVGESFELFYEAYCEPHEIGDEICIGLKSFEVHFILEDDSRAKLREGSVKHRIDGFNIEAHSTSHHLFLKFWTDAPPLRFRRIDLENALAILVDVRPGEKIEIQMLARYENAFVQRRKDRVVTLNRQKLIDQLGARLRLGDVERNESAVCLSRQTLSVEARE